MAQKKAQEPEEIMGTEQKRNDYLNELVTFQLFKDGDKYKDDVLVCINGERLLIKRGEEVQIPRKFALVLEQSRAQDAATAARIEEKSSQFEEESRARDL